MYHGGPMTYAQARDFCQKVNKLLNSRDFYFNINYDIAIFLTGQCNYSLHQEYILVPYSDTVPGEPARRLEIL